MMHGIMYELYMSIWHSLHMGHEVDMQWHIALHMHGDIALHGCECMVVVKHQTW